MPSLMLKMLNNESIEKQDREKEVENELVLSYKTRRNLIGISGLLLPFVLVFLSGRRENDRLIENSISDYYYSTNGDILVVILSVLGVFLFSYRGYDWNENVLTTIAAGCGIGVAFSPTATQQPNSLSIHVTNNSVPMVGIERHFVFASLFFLALAVMTLYYFPQSDNDPLKSAYSKRQKNRRNRMYRICGLIIIICVLLLSLYFLFKPFSTIIGIQVVLFFVTIAVEAFGLAWLTKGQTFWPDEKHYLKKVAQQIKTRLLTMLTYRPKRVTNNNLKKASFEYSALGNMGDGE